VATLFHNTTPFTGENMRIIESLRRWNMREKAYINARWSRGKQIVYGLLVGLPLAAGFIYIGWRYDLSKLFGGN
jgi:hypothetical protein